VRLYTALKGQHITNPGQRPGTTQNKMKKLLILTTALMLTTAVKTQTATPMAQYAGNQLIFNPGFAGAHDLFSANLSYRTLWVGMPNSPTLISFNMHAPFINQRNALGFIFQRETFGPQAVNLVNLTYAYNFRVGANSFLSLGVQGGFLNSVTDWSMVDRVRHPEDPFYGRDERWTTIRFDMGFGIHYQARDFYIGISARHLTAPRFDEIRILETGEQFYSQIRRQFFLMSGYNFMLNNNFDLRPRLLMRHKEGVPLTVSVGADLVYDNRFSFGVNLMSGLPALTLAAAVEVFSGLRIGYAFDINFGTLGPFQRGSHEIFISYFLPVWNRVQDPAVRRQHFR